MILCYNLNIMKKDQKNLRLIYIFFISLILIIIFSTFTMAIIEKSKLDKGKGIPTTVFELPEYDIVAPEVEDEKVEINIEEIVAELADEMDEDSPIITKEMLVQNEWGAENGGMGKWIEFLEDGTFNTINKEPTEYYKYSGDFRIEDNVLILDINYFNDEPIDETEFKGVTRTRIFTLEDTVLSLYLTHFLEEYKSLYRKYWNQGSTIPKGSTRILEGQIFDPVLIPVSKTLRPSNDADIYTQPNANSGIMAFLGSCAPDCEDRLVYTAKDVVFKVIARTNFREKVNGVEDYWYYVDLESGWGTSLYVDGKDLEHGGQFGWIHGSEIK